MSNFESEIFEFFSSPIIPISVPPYLYPATIYSVEAKKTRSSTNESTIRSDLPTIQYTTNATIAIWRNKNEKFRNRPKIIGSILFVDEQLAKARSHKPYIVNVSTATLCSMGRVTHP